jgi:metallo-beta-lactamase class B
MASNIKRFFTACRIATLIAATSHVAQAGDRTESDRPDKPLTRIELVSQWHNKPETLKAPAVRIADNLFYVGNRQFSSHLLIGEKEIVLIDTPYASHFDMLVESIRSVGVDPTKISLILHTHRHYDHHGATYRMKELSGAKTAVGAKEIRGPLQNPYVLDPVEQRNCERNGWTYEPFVIDMLLEHDQEIDVGGTTIHCHDTPGHTPGAMSYSFRVTIDGKKQQAFLFGGPGLATLQWTNNGYPGDLEERRRRQVADFTDTFAYLKKQRVDVPLGAHPFMNDTLGKYDRLQNREQPSPFLDPAGWDKFLVGLETRFRQTVSDLNEKQAREPK